MTKSGIVFDSSFSVYDEWDWIENFPLKPEDFTIGSNKKVWWEHFGKDGQVHRWQATINRRIGGPNHKGTNCPFCNGRKVGYGNDLATLFPEIAAEWHPTKNKKGPECYLPGSNVRVWWCHVALCGQVHEWEAIIKNRTLGKTRCSFCCGDSPGYGNDLATLFPEISAEWHPTKNILGPGCYLPGSDKEVWWQHITDEGVVHEWKAVIKNRVINHTCCPHCVQGPWSKIANEWLDSLGIPNLYRETREFTIKIGGKTFVVDGYDPETNTVYEFLGNIWHGNPEMFSPDYINPMNKKLAGEAYQETISRLDSIKQAGYSLVYIWEADFVKSKL